MGRLVDAELFKTVVGDGTKLRKTICELIDKQPTAYNVEEVVKELKEVAFLDIDENYADDGQQMLFLHDAIEIVKGGVKNE